MSISRIVVFLLVVNGISAAIHSYLWWRLVSTPAWPAPWPRILSGVLIAGALAIPLTFIASRALPKVVASPLAWVGYVWMGLMFLLLVWTLPGELVRAGAWVSSKFGESATWDARRLFIARALAGLSFAAAGSLGLFGIWSVSGVPKVKKVSVRLAKLPGALAGLRVVQVTDIHVGTTIGKTFIEGLVARINALEADVVAITGDLVDGSVEALGAAVQPLANLKAKHGVYFVTGNHEYYSGADAWIAFLQSLNVKVLRNEHVALEKDGATFHMAGIDDWSAHGFGGGHGADLPRALHGRDPAHTVILLAHQPKAFAEAAKHGVDLQLSGHTHGGQIKPFDRLTRLDTPYVAGLYAEGASQLYVSSGTGYWGPPMRVGVPPEITLLELTPA